MSGADLEKVINAAAVAGVFVVLALTGLIVAIAYLISVLRAPKDRVSDKDLLSKLTGSHDKLLEYLKQQDDATDGLRTDQTRLFDAINRILTEISKKLDGLAKLDELKTAIESHATGMASNTLAIQAMHNEILGGLQTLTATFSERLQAAVTQSVDNQKRMESGLLARLGGTEGKLMSQMEDTRNAILNPLQEVLAEVKKLHPLITDLNAKIDTLDCRASAAMRLLLA